MYVSESKTPSVLSIGLRSTVPSSGMGGRVTASSPLSATSSLLTSSAFKDSFCITLAASPVLLSSFSAAKLVPPSVELTGLKASSVIGL